MKRLLSSSKYEWIFSLTILLFFVASMIAMLILFFPKENSLWIKFIVLAIHIIFILLCIFAFLLSFQYAVLSENGIIIKCLVCTLSKISWAEITNISIDNQEIASRLGAKIYKKFIVFFTKSNVSNKKNKIIFTNKNYQIIKEFLNLYSNNTPIFLDKLQ